MSYGVWALKHENGWEQVCYSVTKNSGYLYNLWCYFFIFKMLSPSWHEMNRITILIVIQTTSKLLI